MNSELRHWIFNNGTQMISNLHEDITTVISETEFFTITTNYYADNTKEIIKASKTSSDKHVEIIKDNKDYYKHEYPLEVFSKYNNYTLTKNLDTNVIEKNYVWHPFISTEEFKQPDKKQVNFK